MEIMLNVSEERSLEECIKEFVKDLDPIQRLEAAIDVIERGLETEERSQDIMAMVWELVLREGWWKARYQSVESFTSQCGVIMGVGRVIAERDKREKLKSSWRRMVAESWGGEQLETALGDLMPSYTSKHFLRRIKTFAGEVTDLNEAKERLSAALDARLKKKGSSNDGGLQVKDVETALMDFRAGRPTQASQIEAVTEDVREESDCSGIDGVEKGNRKRRRIETSEEGSMDGDEIMHGMHDQNEVGKGRSCYCEDESLGRKVGEMVKEFQGKELVGKVQELDGLESWAGICYQHVKLIAGQLGLQTQGMNRGRMIERLESLQKNKDRLDILTRERGTYEWFRINDRPEHEDDRLGPFKYAGLPPAEFRFDSRTLWERYAGVGGMEKFYSGGNLVVSGVFDWIVNDTEVMSMVDAEFEMYRHHLREQNGVPNYGWCRNMVHSLVQQAMRQDPVFYALNVVGRPDRNWRLVSFPYYTKYAVAGDSTRFKHIDINVRQLFLNGRGGSTVQTGISMDDEFEDGCTIVVPGFHRQIEGWWEDVKGRGEVKDGVVQNLRNIYTKEDEERYGRFVPVVCKRGDVRLTLAKVIHGSTGCVRVRRVIHPWLVGIDADDGGLDFKESGSYEEVCQAHRNMEPMQMEPTGQGKRWREGLCKFAGAVQMRGVSALGDALVGAQGWDCKRVRMERDLILGADGMKAREYVDMVRSKMVQKWKEYFKLMVEGEVSEYGENAYFRGVDVLYSMGSGS